jgi:hypothetical protein
MQLGSANEETPDKIANIKISSALTEHVSETTPKQVSRIIEKHRKSVLSNPDCPPRIYGSSDRSRSHRQKGHVERKENGQGQRMDARKSNSTGMSLVAMHWLDSDVSWVCNSQLTLPGVSAEYPGPTPNSRWYISSSCSVGPLWL